MKCTSHGSVALRTDIHRLTTLYDNGDVIPDTDDPATARKRISYSPSGFSRSYSRYARLMVSERGGSSIRTSADGAP